MSLILQTPNKRPSIFKRVYVLLIAALFLSGCQAYIQKTFLPNDGIRPATLKVTVTRDVGFTTQDGTQLVADLFQPTGISSAPTILVRVPFTNTFSNRLRSDAIAYFWAGRGYNAVIQGTRGRYKSSGELYPLLHEREDGLATLQWLSKQAWFDGRLGMWGGSAFGYTQWVLADQAAPGPSALMIQIASTDFHGMFYPGGALSLESALFWAVRSHGKTDIDPSFDDLEKGFQGFPLIEADNRATTDITFFNDWVSHSQRDDYWQAIDGTNRAKTLKAPVLLMAGWFDPFLPTQIADFKKIQTEADVRIGEKSRLVIGPWSHADTISVPGGPTMDEYRKAALAPSIDWFDQFLMGRPVANQSPVRIFVMGDNVWRDEQTWPPERARTVSFYLAEASTHETPGALALIPERPTQTAANRTYIYDPLKPTPTQGGAMLGPRAGIAVQNEIEQRDDVIVFYTEPLERDIEVTGNVSVTLHVATTAPHTDFTAKLVNQHADGTVYNVTDGILRRGYGAPQQGTTEISINLWPTSMVFKKGHRIGLEISSSNFPRYDRNPNTGGNIPLETHPTTATQSIYFGSKYPSRLLLSVIPR